MYAPVNARCFDSAGRFCTLIRVRVTNKTQYVAILNILCDETHPYKTKELIILFLFAQLRVFTEHSSMSSFIYMHTNVSSIIVTEKSQRHYLCINTIPQELCNYLLDYNTDQPIILIPCVAIADRKKNHTSQENQLYVPSHAKFAPLGALFTFILSSFQSR